MAPEPDVDQGWVTSSYSSGSGECVEVKRMTVAVGVRDSKDPRGAVLTFSAAFIH